MRKNQRPPILVHYFKKKTDHIIDTIFQRGQFRFILPGAAKVETILFFANNNTNYTCWLPMYLRDILRLALPHQHIKTESLKGIFTSS